ncbi:negative elongation factor E [Dermatophagoides farinae]|uniref:Negative elongation factor E n=1 Tax=Dermatophagoides farinae TaxID=6954 RepID=A0A922LCQ4_DERFA|nr:negative elongation factor E-like [Dermatophagoides farinae]KAH7642609.1 negative elongation factor e-like protein [Dermatophagoides farinae]KAH9529932.1 Serine/threonine-protein kinase N2 [Dermatophagoides farinae]
MTLVQLPSKLTEEEQALQRKYQKLKRKKKLLQQLKTPKQEQPAIQPVKRTPDSGTDAKEVAKKLLKSGKIQAIKAPDNKDRQDSGFKRSKAHERKRCTGTDKPGGYLPFHNHHSDDDPNGPKDEPESKRLKPLYESFVMSRDPHSVAREEAFREKKRDGKVNYVNRDNPQQGNTIYVHGENISEDILRLAFSTFGPVLNITAEPNKNCGFVTYDSIDIANMAITEMNGKTINGIHLKVSLARRQPVYNPEKSKSNTDLNETLSAPEAWSAIASNFSDSVDNPKERTIVSYDDDMYETV